jgi:hypothetical protein
MQTVTHAEKTRHTQVGENTPYRHGCGHILGISPLALSRRAPSCSVEMTGLNGLSFAPPVRAGSVLTKKPQRTVVADALGVGRSSTKKAVSN